MSVLIKGMEMPRNCLDCPLQGGTVDCRLTQKTYNWGLTERPSDCPLFPVPPHGRLIDGDALFARVQERVTWWAEDYDLCGALSDIEDAETIIEKEEQ